ncbi:hypothetical protein OPQ81_006495 [Rhizoctonia solani]|nr:hypothetical protein OPQ81_006495 [Rhizoctonia solani]
MLERQHGSMLVWATVATGTMMMFLLSQFQLPCTNKGGNCNQWVEVVNTANGKKVYAKMRDSCPPCGDNDIDLSPKAFKALAPLSQGVVSVSWHFMNRNWSP